jgi:hypothetical protein
VGILTNNHVVGGASKINVLLSNGKQHPAELIGTDPKTALLFPLYCAGGFGRDIVDNAVYAFNAIYNSV